MPAFLVLVVSLIQDNILKSGLDAAIVVLVADEDGGQVAQRLRDSLRESTGLTIVDLREGRPLSRAQALAGLGDGEAQVALVIARGTTQRLEQAATEMARRTITADEEATPPPPPVENWVRLYFEPTVQGGFKAAVTQAVERLAQGIEMDCRLARMEKELPVLVNQVIAAALAESLPPDLAVEASDLPAVLFHWDKSPLLSVSTEYAVDGAVGGLPSSVQQNVPAWALFGMFFIVVPLAGTMIREREQGTLRRLLVMPVSAAVLLLGKVAAYVLVCCGQFLAMLAIGRWVLPRLGTPTLELGSAPLALLCLVLACSLAATGYGIMVGALARTYEQASMFGAVSVVIAAAVGGIMIPVYVMPSYMRAASQISPLAWGHEAFLAIFVRQGGISEIGPQLTLLGAFAAVCLTIASAMLFRRALAD
jgi:ABC-2 type transport system permease protein